MALSNEAIEIIGRKAEHIKRDDGILSIPNDKYVERHIFYYEATSKYYVQYSVYDNIVEHCYFTDGDAFDQLWKAEDYYDSILRLIEGKVFIYGEQ